MKTFAFSAFAIGVTLAVAASARAQSVQTQPAFRADEFSDFVGINGSPLRYYVIPDGPYKGAGATYTPDVFYDLGIRHYRTGLQNDLVLADQPQQVLDVWRKTGAQPMLLIDHNKTKTADEVMAKLRLYDPRAVGEIEGPNEVNNKFPPQNLNIKYNGKTDEAAGAQFTTDVYRAMKADATWKNLPMVAYSAIFTDYRLAKGYDGFDFANMHSYQGYDVPSSSILMNQTRFNNALPVGGVIKPYVPTECGYNVDRDVSNGTFKTGSLRAQALNVPMLLAEYFRHGIRRTYLFALQNADGYGLLESDLKTKRPSYFAVKNFLAQIKDANWNPQTLSWNEKKFAPRSLNFSLQGAPPSIHTVTLQKSDGSHLLMIWNEARNFDQDANKDISNPPIPVTLRADSSVFLQDVLKQNDAGGYDSQKVKSSRGVDGVTLQLDVPSSVMLVKLRPAVGVRRDITAPNAPANLRGQATENRVSLSWDAATPEDTGGVAGYFVWRNGAYVATVTNTKFEDASAWIRPGLGYTFAVQAFDKSGNASPRVETVVQTSPKFPDLIVSNAEVPRANVGDKVKFRATLTNVGQGATPNDAVTGVTFFVDGQFTSWWTTEGKSIAPGESLTMNAFGGPAAQGWTATLGAHLLRAQADDINRVPGESNEFNNDCDRTLLVGDAGRGQLLGASDPAPFAVDLTKDGALDWIHRGLGGKDKLNRKAGANLLSDISTVGQGYMDATSGAPLRVSWSDGVPTRGHAASNDGLWLNGVGHGYTFSAPADATERVLRVYVGGLEGARGKLTAHLSDNSAPDYVSTTWNGNAAFDWAPVPGTFAAVYTLRYKSAAPNQTLQVTWTLDGEPNAFAGQARLSAVTLSRP